MCLVAVAFGVSKEIPFALAANRDEFFARPAAPAAWWSHRGVEIFGGRDIEKGGTWLGLTRKGRIALVTNVRNPSEPQETGKKPGSRGWLVREALTADALPPDLGDLASFPSFNLMVGEGDTLFYLRDGAEPSRVEPGFHAVSNARLDTPWPKVQSALRAMQTTPLDDAEALFRLLSDDVPAKDADLPATGVPQEVERALSPPFVRLPEMGYGTRCSTVVQRHKNGEIRFEERTFDARGTLASTVRVLVNPHA